MMTILDDNWNPSSLLLELLEALSLEHDGSLQSIVAITQQEWLKKIRPPGVERWQIDPNIRNFFELKRSELYHLFQNMGFYNKSFPQKQYYDYVLLFGHPLYDFCKLLAYLIDLHKTGLMFGELVVLTGRRPLDFQEEHRELFNHIFSTMLTTKDGHFADSFPDNETELIEYIMNIVQLPQQWSSISLKIIDALMKYDEKNSLIRPTTGDTIEQWMLHNPQPGSILAFSNQPYCMYQESVLKTLLPPKFSAETIGDIPSDKDDYIVIYLDTLARFLYQEQKRRLLVTV